MGSGSRPIQRRRAARGAHAAGGARLSAAPPGREAVGHRGGFAALLFLAMGVAMFTMSAFSVLASSLIDDLGISRQQLGLAATVNVALSAVVSPLSGSVIDRAGGRRGLAGVFLTGGIAFLVMGLAVAYWILLIGAVIAAFSQAAANPATNKLIAQHVPDGRRGLVTGIKQSGVQGGTFFGGLLLPFGAATIGWRPTLTIAGLATILIVVPGLRLVPPDVGDDTAAGSIRMRLPTSTTWLAVYGGLLGVGGSATFFVPLFAEESLGYGAQAGGLAAGLIGLVGLLGRIVWARAAERRQVFIGVLGTIAVVAVGAGGLFLASLSAPGLLWVAVVVIGLSSSSWNSVAMLAVMRDAGSVSAGRASGRVMLGFLVGLGVAPPVYGRIIDGTGSYAAMWWIATAAFALAAVTVLLWSRSVAVGARRGVASSAGEEGRS